MIANGQILSDFDRVICPRHAQIFLDDNLSKCQGILSKLGTCIDIKIWFGIADGQISSVFDSYLAYDTIMAGYYS